MTPQDAASRALASLDLTSLNDDDTDERIDALCDRALDGRFGSRPAAVCVYPRFAHRAAARLAGSGIHVAVVVNFPEGTSSVDAVCTETIDAIGAGTDEIDLVFPYRAFLEGRLDDAMSMVRAIELVCHDRAEPLPLKVILETGALADPSMIQGAAMAAVMSGADFLKTSTGKIPEGATPDAVIPLLEVIAQANTRGMGPIGLKVSGGVRTVEDAERYLTLADRYIGEPEVGPHNFRFGASGLYDDIVRVLSGRTPAGDATGSSTY
jgi:deoxyribose-phosphate aldolase